MNNPITIEEIKTYDDIHRELKAEREGGYLQGIVGRIGVAVPRAVPKEIAVCPECGSKLTWQLTTSDGLRDLDIDCRYDSRRNPHRNWQGEWQPIYDTVRKWIRKTYSPNDKAHRSAPGVTVERKETHE